MTGLRNQHTHLDESPTRAEHLLSSITLNSTTRLPFCRREKHSSSKQPGHFPSSTKAKAGLSLKVSDLVSTHNRFSLRLLWFLLSFIPIARVLLSMAFSWFRRWS